MMKKILLIDGHSILNRAFYGVPVLTNSKGVHTNAVYGFINIMLKAMDDEKADMVLVAFDLKEPTFRHRMFAEYKGTRKPMPAELVEQVPIMKDMLSAMNIPVVTLPGYEADDILGTLSKRFQREGGEVSVLSGDRDLLQLADTHIKIRMPKTSKGKTEIENYFPDDVVAKYGVTPTEFIDLKALMGDSSDNILGVAGIGEKTASAIISQYHSIEEAYRNVDTLKPPKAAERLRDNYDTAVLSKTLATIDVNAPVEFDASQYNNDIVFTQAAYDMCVELELKSLLNRFEKNSFGSSFVPEYETADDFTAVDGIFADAANAGICGVSADVDGVSLCFSDRCIHIPAAGFITADMLKDKLFDLSKTCRIVGINIKDSLEYFCEDAMDNIDDVAIMAYLINPLKESYSFGDIAIEYMGRTVEDTKVSSAYVAFNSYAALNERIQNMGMSDVYRKIEIPVMFVLHSMEKEGIGVNPDALKAYGESLIGRIDELTRMIYEEAGGEFNINSPKQLGEILFDKLGLPAGKKTQKGYSTSADVLEKLAPDYPIVANILEYRTLAKLKSTYADGLYEYIAPDGRIHSRFNQTVTATGRISSTEPNLQNIPIRMEIGRQIRKVFIPKDGCVFVDADYSQIELRILAHMSADDTLIEAYKSDSDIHRITASKVFKVPLSEVTKEQRSNAKAVNFGIVYGISSFGLSRDLSISKAEAKRYIEEYFATYPSIKTFLDKLVADAVQNGYVTTIYGRRRPIPEISSSNFMTRQFGERIAMNSPLQGTAADIIKIAMVNVYKRLKKENFRSRLILQIHDELLVEAYKDEADAVAALLKEEMENAADLLVDLIVEVNRGDDWYEAK